MKRKYIELRVIVIIALLLNALSACSINEGTTEIEDASSTGIATPVASGDIDNTDIPSHISNSYTCGDIQVVIEADVTTEHIDDASIVELEFCESNLNLMADELILELYSDANQTASGPYEYQWLYLGDEDTVTSLYATNNGSVNYYDSARDINGSSADEDHIFEYGYFTDAIPQGMTISSEDAAVEAANFLAQYTPFEYRAYNILTSNDNEHGEGYYEINLEVLIDGIPVFSRSGGDEFYFPINPKINISSEGIFEFQGRICFEIQDKIPLESYFTLDEVLNKFVDDIGMLASGETIFVNRIYLAYIPIDSEDDQLTSLVPVWCFECIDSRTENGQEINIPITTAYSIENGRFIGEYY